MKKIVYCVLTFLVAMTSVLAKDKEDLGKIARPIEVKGEHKYKMLYLDKEVYQYANRDLSDIRIVDEAGTTVPYYIQDDTYSYEEEKTYEVAVIDNFIKNEWNYTDLKIEDYRDQKDVVIDLLSLTINDNDSAFAKDIRVFGGYDGINWTFIREDILFRVQVGEKNEIQFENEVKYPFYRIGILQNNGEVFIEGARASYLTQNTKNNIRYISEKQPFERKEDKEKAVTSLVVKNEQRLNIDKIELKAEGNFRREYQLWGIEEGKETFLSSGVIYSMHFKENSSRDTEIPLEDAASYKTLEIRIINKDDQPIKIEEMIATYVVDKLVFEASGEHKYTLRYGKEEMLPPSYDIETYQANIEREEQDLCTLGNVIVEEPGVEGTKGSFVNGKLVYTCLITLVSVLLIVLIVKGMNKKTE